MNALPRTPSNPYVGIDHLSVTTFGPYWRSGMMDFVFIGVAIGFFALAILYTTACDQL